MNLKDLKNLSKVMDSFEDYDDIYEAANGLEDVIRPVLQKLDSALEVATDDNKVYLFLDYAGETSDGNIAMISVKNPGELKVEKYNLDIDDYDPIAKYYEVEDGKELVDKAMKSAEYILSSVDKSYNTTVNNLKRK